MMFFIFETIALVLDLLPYKQPARPRLNIGFIRYIVFAMSLAFVVSLFARKVEDIQNVMWWSFMVGNLLYYIVGIVMAFIFKDNRAFCKYICPITVFLKPASYFSLLRVKNQTELCIRCGKCKKVCPMNVDVMNNSRKREHGTECILCFQCIEECPAKSLHS